MTSPSWHDANLDLRRRRDEMNASKKRQEQERQEQAAEDFAARPSGQAPSPWGVCADAYRL